MPLRWSATPRCMQVGTPTTFRYPPWLGWVLTFARRRVRFVGRISVYGCNNRVGNAGRHNITLNDVNTEAASLHRFLRERCGLPQERCPLASRVVGTVELDDIRIEKVIYDAEPSSSVPAHLYVNQMSCVPLLPHWSCPPDMVDRRGCSTTNTQGNSMQRREW